MRLVVAVLILSAVVHAQAPAAALRIVVLEGEDAVNVIQQKTAVRPLVEVRDRNNLPVAGATVTFTIGGGGSTAAFAGGVPTLTVTTNAAGQAAAGGLNALGSGAFQIQVQAAYQGQIATAAISQTNFATAAAAAQAGSAASGTGGSTGATSGAAGGGGGISGSTIGIAGAAVAGAAVAAAQVAGREEAGGTNSGSSERRFTGPISGQFVMTTSTSSQSGTTTCVSTRTISATITITLRDGNSRGFLQTNGTQQEVSVSGPSCTGLANASIPFNTGGEVTGGPANLAFTWESSAISTSGAAVTSTVTSKFTGSLAGDAITGTFGHQEITRGTNIFNGVSSTIQGSGTSNFAVTLR
jgi:hypothetical protein